MPDIIHWPDYAAAPYYADVPADGLIEASALATLLEWIWRYQDAYDPPPYPEAPELITDVWLEDRAGEIDALRTSFGLPDWTWVHQGDDLLSLARLSELRRALPRVASHGNLSPYTNLASWKRVVELYGASWAPTQPSVGGGLSTPYCGVFGGSRKAKARAVLVWDGIYAPADGAAVLRLRAAFGVNDMAGRSIIVRRLSSVPTEPSTDSSGEAAVLWLATGSGTTVGTLSYDDGVPDGDYACWMETAISGLDDEDPFALAFIASDEGTDPTPDDHAATLGAITLRWSLVP